MNDTNRIRRLTAGLLCLLMVLGMALSAIPLRVHAVGDELFLGGEQLDIAKESYWATNTNGALTKTTAGSSWNIHYNGDHKLTLRNAVIAGTVNSAHFHAAIFYNGNYDLYIELAEGSVNTIKGPSTTVNGDMKCIRSNRSVDISGRGELNIGNATSNNVILGIDTDENVRIQVAKFSIHDLWCGDAYRCGISAVGNIVFLGGSISITGEDREQIQATDVGMWCNQLIVTGSRFDSYYDRFSVSGFDKGIACNSMKLDCPMVTVEADEQAIVFKNGTQGTLVVQENCAVSAGADINSAARISPDDKQTGTEEGYLGYESQMNSSYKKYVVISGYYNLWVGGKQLNIRGFDGVQGSFRSNGTGGGTLYLNEDTTVTGVSRGYNGFSGQYDVTMPRGAGIYSAVITNGTNRFNNSLNQLTISVASGESNKSCNVTGMDGGASVGMYISGCDVTIEGAGTMNVSGGNATEGGFASSQTGIDVDGRLTVQEDVTVHVTADGQNTASFVYAIYTSGHVEVKENAVLTASSRGAKVTGYGININQSNTHIGAYGNAALTVTGTTAAVNRNVETDPTMTVTASTDISGSPSTEYSDDDIATYRYVSVEAVPVVHTHLAVDDGDCTTPVICDCGVTLVEALSHDFSGAFDDYDDDGHFHVCNNENCTQTDTPVAHSGTDDAFSLTPVVDDDCSTPVICICGYIVTAAKLHDFSGTFDGSDTDGHWHICNNEGCTQTDTPVAHSGTDDGDCTTAIVCACGFTMRPTAIAHRYYNVYLYDTEGHWRACINRGCTKTEAKTAHSDTDDEDCTTPVVCKCGYTVTAARSHDFSGSFDGYDTDNHWHICQNANCVMTDTPMPHSGGTVTYNTRAVCTGCGQEYRERAQDNTAPTGEITVGENTWSSFLSNVSFGVFFRESKTATVTASDRESGVAKIEYLLSAVRYDSGEAVGGIWMDITATKQLVLAPNTKQYIYVRITDTAGNSTVINSQGIVIYTDCTPATATVTYTKQNGKTASVQVALNGNTVKEIKNGESTLGGNDYTVAADGTITFSTAYLFSLEKGSHTLTVFYHPQGEAYTAGTGNDMPATTVITMNIQLNANTITFNANPGKIYDGKAPRVSYTFTEDGDVTVEFKAQGALDSTYTESAPRSVGAYTVRVSVSDGFNYAKASNTLDFSIAPKEITITGVTVSATKEYDGTTDAVITNAGALSENFDGERLAFTVGTAAYNDKNAEADKSVTFSGFALTGDARNNYTLVQPASTTADITAKELHIQVAVSDKEYDGNHSAAFSGTPSLVGVLSGDLVTLTNGVPTFTSTEVGQNIPIRFTDFIISGTDAGNYKLIQPTGITASITATQDVCSGVRRVAPQNGTYRLFLNGMDMGDFTFAASGCGYTICNSDGLYLTQCGGVFALKTEPEVWSYGMNSFYQTESVMTGWWWWTRVVSVNYYLTAGENGISVSAYATSAALYESFSCAAHDFGGWHGSAVSGQHQRVCNRCNKTESGVCVFDPVTHICPVCGAYDPAFSEMRVSVRISQRGGFGWWRYTTYYADICVEAKGVNAVKTEYSTDNIRFINGNRCVSSYPIGTLYIRVTDETGTVWNFIYENGTVCAV